MQHIFTNKMLKMDCTQLTPAGYRLFERLFIYINEKNGKIKRYEVKVTPPAAASAADSNEEQPATTNAATEIEVHAVAVASDLMGMSHLWEIAVGCHDPIVADAAIEFLNDLHQNVRLLHPPPLSLVFFLTVLML